MRFRIKLNVINNLRMLITTEELDPEVEKLAKDIQQQAA